jgi:hypothetical protein
MRSLGIHCVQQHRRKQGSRPHSLPPLQKQQQQQQKWPQFLWPCSNASHDNRRSWRTLSEQWHPRAKPRARQPALPGAELKANKDAIARQADHNTELIEAMKQMAAVNAALLEQQKASSKEIKKILSSQIESQASMSENQLEHDGATSTVLGISAYHCWW